MWMTAKPQVAFYSTNPWLMVVGSDSPRFVLYEDGSIIYTKMRDRNRAVDFYSVQLTAEEHQQFLASLHMDDEFWDFSLSLLKYIEAGKDLSEAPLFADPDTDGPSNIWHFWVEGCYKRLEQYGRLFNPEVRTRIPALLLHLYDTLNNYDHNGQ